MALTAGLAVVVLAALLFWIERRKDLPHDYMQEQAAASRVQERASRRTPAPSLFEGPEDSASDRWDLVPKPSPEAEAGEGADEVAWTAEDAGDESTRFAFNRQLLAASAALSELYQAQKSLLGFERSLQFSERYQQRVGGIADDVQRNRATVQLKTTDRNLAAEQYLEELRLLRVYRGPAYAGLLAAFQAVQDRADAPAPKILALVLKHAEEPEATESLVYQRERWLAELAE